MRIAALDHETDQLELIRHTLTGVGHECYGFVEGAALLRELRNQSFDLLILSGHLPDLCGLSVLRSIRQHLVIGLPILFVTQRREEADLVEALTAGADDVMVKPIRVGELEARVQALLRRAYPSQHAVELVFGRYRFRPHAQALLVDGEAIELKHREYQLALMLFRNLGRVLSRQHLREAVWGAGPEVSSRSLDTHISRLRSKLNLRPANGYLLSAIYAMGYRLEEIDLQALLPHRLEHAVASA